MIRTLRSRIIAGVAAAAALGTVGVVAQRDDDRSTLDAQVAATDCWDEYTLTGNAVQRVVRPAGVSNANCTVPTGCLEGFTANGVTRNRIYAPHGRPKSTCTAPPPTTTLSPTTTVAPTTTLPPSTTTTSTTVASTTTTTIPGGRPVQPPNRINWDGSVTFTTGVNVPWMTWPWAAGHGDFGGGATDGVVARKAEIAVGFAKLQAADTHMVRWWAFQQDAWQINRSADGTPTSINPAVYADFDAALVLAEQYDLYYDFVLFGSSEGFPATWRTNPAQRTALATALGPLFARYKDNPRVMSWEIFNEPEYPIWNSGGVVAEADVKAMASAIIASIRSNAPKTLVTVGQALVAGYNDSQRGIAMWTDVDLDFYSPHWYDGHTSPTSICALCTTAPDLQALYGTTKPIVIGEYQQGSGSTSANVSRMNQWYDKGYAGAWGWSLFPENTGDGHPTDFTAMTTFNSQHTDIGPTRLGPPPPTTTTTTVAPTTTTTVAPTTTTTVAPTTTTIPAGAWTETFDGPATLPTPFTAWSPIVHWRDAADRNGEVIAGHGAGCEAPPATHPVTATPDHVFLCGSGTNRHMMTSINGGEYGMIAQTLPVKIDFLGGATLDFDVSTKIDTARDWWDVWITPVGDVQPLPGDPDLPDPSVHPANNGIQIRLSDWESCGEFCANNRTGIEVWLYRNGSRTLLNTDSYTGMESFLTPSAAVRSTIHVSITRTRLTLSMPEFGQVYVNDRSYSQLAWSQGVIQVNEHSYNPLKDDTRKPLNAVRFGTWHWDNFAVNPAVPL